MHDEPATAIESTHSIDAALPAFEGHFAGAPVLPGAYLLAIVLRELERQPALRALLGATLQVQEVKFLAAVAPGQTLLVRLQPRAQAIDFAVQRGATLVARGQVGSTEAAAA